MAAYAIGTYRIRDAAWRSEYRQTVGKLVAKHGGRYLVRSDAAWETLEGLPPNATGFTVIEFPSMEQARAWYQDPEYQPMIRLRQTGSELDLVLVEGTVGPSIPPSVLLRADQVIE